jgi:hypothetical protein
LALQDRALPEQAKGVEVVPHPVVQLQSGLPAGVQVFPNESLQVVVTKKQV